MVAMDRRCSRRCCDWRFDAIKNQGGYFGMAKKSQTSQFRIRQLIFVWGIIALPLLQWIVCWLFVNVSSIKLAFTDPRTSQLTFRNFQLFWENLTSPYGEIKIALSNTLKYFSTNLLIINPFACIVAYFLYKKIAGYKAYRVIFYLPAIVSSVAMVEAYRQFIGPGGALNALLNIFGASIPPEGLFARNETATGAILAYTIWTGCAANMLLFMGAMTRVPTEVLEAAKLDGCSAFMELMVIILPLILPTISTVVIVTCTNVFSASGPILLFTKGACQTTTIAYWIFAKVYGDGVSGGSSTANYNIVSCTGLCFTLVGAPLIMGIRWLMDKLPTIEY